MSLDFVITDLDAKQAIETVTGSALKDTISLAAAFDAVAGKLIDIPSEQVSDDLKDFVVAVGSLTLMLSQGILPSQYAAAAAANQIDIPGL